MYLTFKLDEQWYALPYSIVNMVVQVVDIMSLPQTSELVMGVIDIHGEIVPVCNLRTLFDLESREILLSDNLIIIRKMTQSLALIVDEVGMITDCELLEKIDKNQVLDISKYVDGFIKSNDKLIPILNLDESINFAIMHQDTYKNIYTEAKNE